MSDSRAERFVRDAHVLLATVPDDAEPPTSVGDVYVFNDDDGNVMASLYVGSYMNLDPCGRYHHHGLSPNRITGACVRFWSAVDFWAEKLGLMILAGDGDPTDILAVRLVR